jgi:hypothetical protein
VGLNLAVTVADSDWFDMLSQQSNLAEVALAPEGFWKRTLLTRGIDGLNRN